MPKYKYEAEVAATSNKEADIKMRVALALINKLSVNECLEMEKVINNPIQFAIVKAKLQS